ncbi:pyrroloquinoline-quinone synthase [Bradyrhizobium diazoefficiens]
MNAASLTGITALSIGKDIKLNSAEELEAALRHIGATRYHSLHPFHKLLHGGMLNKGQVQAWALNRYYYQSTIPIKDAVVISRFRDRATRLEWRHRIEDHDGDVGSEGGIERWLKLTEGLGLDTAYVESTEGILPATRFAVEAYVHYCREKSPLEAIASSLTELFAPSIHEERIAGMLQHYDFVNPDIMSYFKRRLTQGAARCQFRARICQDACEDAGGACLRVQCADLQDQRAVGAARCAPARLCRGPHSAGRVRAQRKLKRRAEEELSWPGRVISASARRAAPCCRGMPS